MKNRALLILILILSIVNNSFSQATCGFDQIHDQKMKTDPVYRETMLRQEEQLRQYIAKNKAWLSTKSNSPQAPLYVIPVVVHVIHTGGSIGTIYNPTDVQIQNTIAYLNQVYDGTYPGLEGVGEIQLQFVLAQRDPNCNPTNGINRVDGSGVAEYVTGGVELQTTNGSLEINIKNLSRWSHTAYYNIWIVNRIDGNDGTSGSFVAGYAYFPGAGATVDGTVMLATQMAPGSTTLPHEIGHAFNLYHPFQGSSGPTCPTESNCATQNDMICDIDPVTTPVGFACRTGNNPCTGTPYTINSEHNIMNYVSCPTLFTLDQKTRMLASAGMAPRLSLSTSLGGTPTNVGGSQCPPKINFQLSDDVKTETTTATSGCRSYTDYTYNMTIGNNPSAAATATLNISAGTATEGVDFDVTTNGNFTTPSKALTFPTGTNASQPFTIRIYNDAIVDGTETFTLAYTLNNGGGNALVGEAKPTLILTINDNDISPSGPSNITRSIGTNVGLLQSPFHAGNTRQKSQFLYKAAELTGAGIPAGNLIGLALNLQKNGGAAFVYQGLTIKIGATSQNSVYNGTTEFPINDAGFTTVYSSNYTTVNGWNTFNFTTPFVWNGTSNVCIVICYDNLGAIDVTDNIQAYTDGIANSNYVFQTTINCGGNFTAFSLYNGGLKPIIQLTYPDAGTIVQTTLNASKQEYLGANADVYFYDQTDNRLLARIKNNTNHDYGCTQVVIDRAGTASTAFWNNNAPNFLMNKTFRVLPTTNNASGNYDITFYFNQAEVNGWQSATGQVFNNIQMVKVQSQVLNVSPGNPTGGGAVQLVTPGRGSLGSNYFISANFTNGFSGFGFGLAGTALPVKLIDFTGRLEKNSVVLDWKTALEQNSKGFSIERSYDGNNFTPIGFVPSAGTSNVTLSYTFKDLDVAQQINYYRLKQLDLDNQFEYSKVVTIKNTGNQGKPFLVMNNPFKSSIDLQFSQMPAGNVRVRLMDVAGKTIQVWNKNNPALSRMRLNTNGWLQAGTYILEVRANGQEYVEKVIKQ